MSCGFFVSRSEMCLRPMTPADLDQVMAIERASFPFPWSTRFFLEELRVECARSLVVETDGNGYKVVRAVLQIASQPAYVEVDLLDRLERKLLEERGQPPPYRRDPPKLSVPTTAEDHVSMLCDILAEKFEGTTQEPYGHQKKVEEAQKKRRLDYLFCYFA